MVFPQKFAKIIRTPKGTLVLKECHGWWVADVLIKCGYRGESVFRILSPEEAERFDYLVYSSPRGREGISAGALINAPLHSYLRVEWKREGRLYGASPKGITIYKPEGEEETLTELSEEEFQELRAALSD